MKYQMRRRSFLGWMLAAGAASIAGLPHKAQGAARWQSAAAEADLQIVQTSVGNVFISGEPAEFSVVTTGDSISWTVHDYWGAQVGGGSAQVQQNATVRAEVPGPGHYGLAVTALRQGTPIATSSTTFAVLSPFDVSQVTDSQFGANTHFGQQWSPGLIPLIVKAGVKNTRDEIRWADVESTKGTYAFPAAITTYMGDLQQSGIDPLIIFDYTNPNYDNGATPFDDAGRSGFADYAAAVVRQFGHQIRWAEVWNEFNQPSFGDRGNGPANSRADFYFPLLKATYEQVKAQDPGIVIVGPVVNGIPLDWLRELFELGGLQYLDAVSVHLYPLPDPPEVVADSLVQLQQLIRRYNSGHDKPVWVTEQGWPTYIGPTGVTSSMQAAYLVRAAATALSQGVDRYFWYDFMNDGLANTQPDNQGLVTNTDDPGGEWTPKPSYAGYAALVRQLTGATYSRNDEAGGGVQSLVFTKEGAPTRVVWSDTPTTLALIAPNPVTVTDLVGASAAYSPDQGRVYLSVSGDPLYVAGAVESVTRDGRYTLSGADGGTTFLQDPVRLSLVVDNTLAPRSGVEGVFQIMGTSIPVSVPADQRRAIDITLAPEDDIGERTFIGQLVVSGTTAARLTAEVSVVHPIALQAKHVLSDGADVLAVTATNASDTSLAVGELAWQIGDQTGTAAIGTPLPGGSSRSVNIPLSGLATSNTYDVQLRLPVLTYPDVTFTGAVAMVDHSSLTAIPKRSIVVDGVLDDLTGIPGVDLTADGVRGTEPGYQFGGTDDLSGTVWLTWDDQRLYLSARIHDNVQYQPYQGWQLWAGDSVQLGVTPGLPGERSEWYIATLALGSNGPELYFTHNSNPDVPVGVLGNASIAVSRDGDDTTYELAIPWSDLPPFQPGDQLLSVAVVANDNDGAGRNDWISWGGGVTHGASEARTPNLFRAAFLST